MPLGTSRLRPPVPPHREWLRSARFFVHTQKDYAECSSPIAARQHTSLAFWYYSDNVTPASATVLAGLFNRGSSQWNALYVSLLTSAKIQVVSSANNGFAGAANSTTTLAVNTWYLIGAEWSPKGDSVFINGVQEGHTGTFDSPTNLTALELGAGGLSSRTAHGRGYIQDLTVWRWGLTATDWGHLRRGRSPLRVQPRRVLRNVNYRDEQAIDTVTGEVLTTSGLDDFGVHHRPRNHAPRKRRSGFFPAATGAATQTQTASLNAALQAQDQLLTASLTGALQTSQTETASLEAAIADALSASASVDAALAASAQLTAALTAALQDTATAPATLNAAVSKALTVALSLDGAASVSQSLTASLNASLTGASASTVQASLDAALQLERTGTVSLAGALQVGQTLTATLNAALAELQTLSASLDASITGAAGTLIQASLSAALQRALTLSTSMDAALASVDQTVAVSLSGAAAVTYTLAVTLDGVLAQLGTVTADLSGALRATQTATVSLDARLGDAVTPNAKRTLIARAHGRTLIARTLGRRNTAH